MTPPREATVRQSMTTPRRLRAGLGNPVTASPRLGACASTCSIKTESAAGTEKRGAGQAAAIEAGPSEDGREGDSMTHPRGATGTRPSAAQLGFIPDQGTTWQKEGRQTTVPNAQSGASWAIRPNPCKAQRSLAQIRQVSPLSQVAHLAADHRPCGCASAMLSSDSMTSSTSQKPKQPPIPCGQRANSDAWASGRGQRSDPRPAQAIHDDERPSR